MNNKEEPQKRREELLAARAEVLAKMTADGRRAFEPRQAANADGPAAVEQQDGQSANGGNLAREIESLIAEVRRFRQDAQRKGDFRLALRGMDTALRALSLWGRATGEITNARRPSKSRAQATIVTRDEAVRTSAEVLLTFATSEQIADVVSRLEQRRLELQSARVAAAGASSNSLEQFPAAWEWSPCTLPPWPRWARPTSIPSQNNSLSGGRLAESGLRVPTRAHSRCEVCMPDDMKLLARVPALRQFLCQQSLLAYCKAVMPKFQAPQHILRLIALWEDIEAGRTPRSTIAIPPRHGKTQLWILAVGWMLGRHPEWQIAVAAYSGELAEGWGRQVRSLISSEAHQAIFPNCRLSAQSAAAHRFELTGGGGTRFVGRGGALLGTGANILIADDLYANADEARSEVIKRNTWDWFTQVFLTRLAPNGAAVVIGSRWAEDDVIGTLLREHATEGWELLHFPALAEANDPLGREEGAALWPEQYPVETLEGIRRQMGSAAFVNIYQGRPAAANGIVFGREWFRTYSDPPSTFHRIVQSWDTAFGKSKQSGDYSVCTTWGVTASGYYLLALWRGRVDFPELKRLVRQLAEEWKPDAIYIEDCASGQSLVQELHAATTYPVIPVKVDRDKLARAQAVTPLFEAGRVFFPAEAPWRRDLEDELASFPVAAHDDQADSITMALNKLREASYADQEPLFKTSELAFSTRGLRDYLDRSLYPYGRPWEDEY